MVHRKPGHTSAVSRIAKACLSNAELCNRLPCVSMTPLGIPVEPEVYCRNAIVSLLTEGSSPVIRSFA